MFRRLFGAVGLAVLLAPRRVVDFFEPVAFENPEVARLRSWTVPMARFEGAVFLAAAVRGRDASPLRKLLGLVGIPAMLRPRQYLDTGLSLAYENPDEIRVKSWVVPVTRALGLLYVLSALRSRGDQDADAAAEDEVEVVTQW